jgi:L-rhamnose isomerase / sugar isomerase
LRLLEIEVPSWGFGDSGTRFATFTQPGRPSTVFERIDDAAEVQRFTGTAGTVALHFPWDDVDDLQSLADHLGRHALRAGAVNPNVFQHADYRLGSLAHPEERVRAKAVDFVVECSRVAERLGSSAVSLWLADGTNYAGQDDFRARRARLEDALRRIDEAVDPSIELLIEYKPFEPAFYATDIADWGSALTLAQKLSDRARVLVDLGHHLAGTNIEQIVALLAHERRLGGFHFNNRRYADDDLITGSVNPFELFLIFVELTVHGDPLPRLTVDQTANVEPKIEAMLVTVCALQEAYAKALLVDRAGLARAQADLDVLGAHEVLLDSYKTDVRPALGRAREALGASPDPVAAFRSSNWLERVGAKRGQLDFRLAGGWGA